MKNVNYSRSGPSFVQPFVLLIAFLTLISAACGQWIGKDKALFLAAFGEPESQLSRGGKEIWIYSGGKKVWLQKDKVIKLQGDFPDPEEAKPVAQVGGTPPTNTTPGFSVPKPTIITEPGYRSEDTWGGESDGLTIGVDGKPLSDHHQYVNDCYHFGKRMQAGLKLVQPKFDFSRLSELSIIVRTQDVDTRHEQDTNFRERYGILPERDNYYNFAEFQVQLDSAYNKYSAAKGNINYHEKLKVADRINLNDSKDDRGNQYRTEMKKAISALQKVRESWQKQYPKIYELGKKGQSTKQRVTTNKERFTTISKDNTRIFLYSKFEYTPLAEGLAEASQDRTLMQAKPIFVPKGTSAQVLANKQIKVPAKGERPELTLNISQIKVKAAGMRQHDGAELPLMTLQGWTLGSNLGNTQAASMAPN